LTKETSFWFQSVAILAAEKGGMLKRNSINRLFQDLESLSSENAREYRQRSIWLDSLELEEIGPPHDGSSSRAVGRWGGQRKVQRAYRHR